MTDRPEISVRQRLERDAFTCRLRRPAARPVRNRRLTDRHGADPQDPAELAPHFIQLYASMN